MENENDKIKKKKKNLIMFSIGIFISLIFFTYSLSIVMQIYYDNISNIREDLWTLSFSICILLYCYFVFYDYFSMKLLRNMSYYVIPIFIVLALLKLFEFSRGVSAILTSGLYYFGFHLLSILVSILFKKLRKKKLQNQIIPN